MHLPVKKRLLKFVVRLAVLGLPLAALFSAALEDRQPIVFESEESHTLEGRPIFNRVTHQRTPDGEIWMMQQSHDGLPANNAEWAKADRLAIRLQTQGRDGPKATFMQLAPGTLEAVNGTLHAGQVRGFKVACGMCHNNGMRAIRPNKTSRSASLGPWDLWRVFVWNLKIKSYGRVRTTSSASESLGKVPFRYRSLEANKPLTMNACTACHRENGPLARGELTKQNYLSIGFMVRSGAMPPLGLPLSSAARQQLEEFMNP